MQGGYKQRISANIIYQQPTNEKKSARYTLGSKWNPKLYETAGKWQELDTKVSRLKKWRDEHLILFGVWRVSSNTNYYGQLLGLIPNHQPSFIAVNPGFKDCQPLLGISKSPWCEEGCGPRDQTKRSPIACPVTCVWRFVCVRIIVSLFPIHTNSDEILCFYWYIM